MKGSISAFYGAKVYADNGKEITTIDNKVEVTVVEPFGKPAHRTGEYVKVQHNETSGWVLASQVHADYN